jgi:acetyltransferase-like isoleucine patch superfamily enzyme
MSRLLYLYAKFVKKVQIPALRNVIIHKSSKVCSNSHIVSSSIGRYTYIGHYTTVINTVIGSFTSIADNCLIGPSTHPVDWVSTSPVFHSGKNVLSKNFSEHKFVTTIKTIIGNDVWIGSNVLIKSGVEIGNGAIIGMGSVVTKNVGEFEIWAGNPAKFIRSRFTEKQVDQLSKLKWWDLKEIDLKEVAFLFNDVNQLIKYMEGSRNEDTSL